jgi:hypothetical protein
MKKIVGTEHALTMEWKQKEYKKRWRLFKKVKKSVKMPQILYM